MPEGKAFSLRGSLHPNSHLWSRTLGSDQKNKIVCTSSQNELPSQGGWAQPEDEELRVELLLLCVERSQFRWLQEMPPGTPHVSAKPIWDETLGQTKDKLERLYLLAGLGTSWHPPAGAGWREECLDLHAQAVAPKTQMSRRKRNETHSILNDKWTSATMLIDYSNLFSCILLHFHNYF